MIQLETVWFRKFATYAQRMIKLIKFDLKNLKNLAEKIHKFFYPYQSQRFLDSYWDLVKSNRFSINPSEVTTPDRREPDYLIRLRETCSVKVLKAGSSKFFKPKSLTANIFSHDKKLPNLGYNQNRIPTQHLSKGTLNVLTCTWSK